VRVYYLEFESANSVGGFKSFLADPFMRRNIMVEDFTIVPEIGQQVTCPSCGITYDASSVDFCDCVTSTRSPRCPSCHKCLCKLAKDQQQAFWESAPQTLWQRKMESRRVGSEPSPVDSGLDLKRPLVLVAEDEAVTRRVAQRVLEKLGYGVLVVDRGDEAFRMARLHHPEVLLTDALMPKLDGRELCLKLKQDPETASIRVILMTGLFTKSQSKSEALQDFKADAFLKKPVDFSELKTVLDDLMGSAAPIPLP
jgi:CheY-like chemotaxis protein